MSGVPLSRIFWLTAGPESGPKLISESQGSGGRVEESLKSGQAKLALASRAESLIRCSMRNKSTPIINGIIAVALLTAGVLAFHFLRAPVATPSDAEPIAALPAPPPPAPWLPRLTEPRA